MKNEKKLESLLNFKWILERLEITVVVGLFKDKATLLKFLDELLKKAEAGFRFCITIASHGNENCIGFKESGEPMLWKELTNHFQAINMAINNTLILNMMSCFGLHAIKMNDFKKDVFPCYGLLGSATKLSSKNAKLINKKIYEKMMDGKEINTTAP